MLSLKLNAPGAAHIYPVSDYAAAYNALKAAWLPRVSDRFFRQALSAKIGQDVTQTTPQVVVMLLIASAVIPSLETPTNEPAHR